MATRRLDHRHRCRRRGRPPPARRRACSGRVRRRGRSALKSVRSMSILASPPTVNHPGHIPRGSPPGQRQRKGPPRCDGRHQHATSKTKAGSPVACLQPTSPSSPRSPSLRSPGTSAHHHQRTTSGDTMSVRFHLPAVQQRVAERCPDRQHGRDTGESSETAERRRCGQRVAESLLRTLRRRCAHFGSTPRQSPRPTRPASDQNAHVGRKRSRSRSGPASGKRRSPMHDCDATAR